MKNFTKKLPLLAVLSASALQIAPSDSNKTWAACTLQANRIRQVGNSIDFTPLERALNHPGISDSNRARAAQKLASLTSQRSSIIKRDKEMLARLESMSNLFSASAMLCVAGAQSSNPLIKSASYAGMTVPALGFLALQGCFYPIGLSLTNQAKMDLEIIAQKEALKTTLPAIISNHRTRRDLASLQTISKLPIADEAQDLVRHFTFGNKYQANLSAMQNLRDFKQAAINRDKTRMDQLD